MKKGESFQKERFSLFSVVNGGGGGVDPRNLPRAYATGHHGLVLSFRMYKIVLFTK